MTCWDGSLRESHKTCPPVPIKISGTYVIHCDYARELQLYFSNEETSNMSSEHKQGMTNSPELTEKIIIPPKYEWVNGEIPGVSKQHFFIPATYKTVTETLTVLPKCYETKVDLEGKTINIIVPEKTKNVIRQIVVSPARIEKRDVPNVIKDGKTRLTIEPSHLVERQIRY